ncbi:MAG: hypothetical protein LBT71_05875 [Azoarcus sp.]|nr:hypothetical protein [Azoarcus sp.]
MRIAKGRYYRTLFGGLLLILGIVFLAFFLHSSSALRAVALLLVPITIGIGIGISFPGILFCVVTSSCLMGYGLVVRKRYALVLFWSGFILFFLAGLMGWHAGIAKGVPLV